MPIQPNFELLFTFANGTVQWTDDIDISPDTLYFAGQSLELKHPLTPVNQAQAATNIEAI
jgi:hypothetical protein